MQHNSTALSGAIIQQITGNVMFLHLLYYVCKHLFFFLVKWNFVSQGEKQLSLEIGDMVHIQEVCDGKRTRWKINVTLPNLTTQS